MTWSRDIDGESTFLIFFGTCVRVTLARNDHAQPGAAFERVLPRSGAALHGTEQKSRTDGNEPKMHNSDKDHAA